MTDLGLQLPLRIFVTEDSVKVIDADGRVAAYVYTAAERERRLQTKRLSPEEGIATAKVIARGLTVELERRGGGVAGDSADLLQAMDALTETAGRW
ncbi:hypothetical protein ACRAWG_39325 (plasmid) [Methylobacterium sp. P31]